MPAMKTKLVLAGATIALLAMYTDIFNISVSIANEDDNEKLFEQQELIIDAQDVRRLVALTGAGSLTIQGVQGASDIRLTADVFADNDSEVELSLVKRGDEAKLVAQIEQQSNWHQGQSPYINVTLTLPADVAIALDDGSGSIDINGMTSDVDIEDGSGSIKVNGANTLAIRDGSGSIKVSNINGAVSIKDGSGSINVDKVNGDIDIDDGSGSMTIEYVMGVVTIDDGSGSITVNDTKGLTIHSAGSGSVDYHKIDGPIKI